MYKNTTTSIFPIYNKKSRPTSNLEVIHISSIDGKTDPIKLMELAIVKFLSEEREYNLDYQQGDTVWFAIDTDLWEKEGKITTLREFCKRQNESIDWKCINTKSYDAWGIAQSNPSLEIWLYYHSYNHRPDEYKVNQCASFKEFVNNSYSGGFDYETDPVRISDAIKNSERNFEKDDDKVCVYSTEMHLLGEEIYKFVKTDINRLRNKIKNG